MIRMSFFSLRWRLFLVVVVSSLGTTTRVGASHASLPSRTTTSPTISNSNHTDDSTTSSKNFIHLPSHRTVDDVLQEKQEVLRGGASISTTTSGTTAPHPDPLVRADYIADTKLPTDRGNFRMRAYRVPTTTHHHYSNTNAMEPIIIYAADKPPFGTDHQLLENVPIRIHDQCLTSEVFQSRRCDCKEQLLLSMDYVQRHGGAVIYLQQEGRGIGLANKVAAYELQDYGLDTVDANLQLGFPDDARQYGVLPSILRDMHIRSIRLMTNNPRKVQRLSALGITITDTIPILAVPNDHNRQYLLTKQERMAHTNFGHILANDDLPAHGITNRQSQQQQQHHTPQHPAFAARPRTSMTPRRPPPPPSSTTTAHHQQ